MGFPVSKQWGTWMLVKDKAQKIRSIFPSKVLLELGSACMVVYMLIYWWYMVAYMVVYCACLLPQCSVSPQEL